MERDPFNNNKPFKMPSEQYFEDFQKRISLKLDLEKQVTSPKIVKLKNKRKYFFMAIAASLLLILGVQIIYTLQGENTFSNDDLQEYLQYNTHIGVSSEFFNSFDQEDILDLERSIQINSGELNDYVLTNLQLEYYLND